ncbi:MAG: hypothetical protein H6767_00555 [Candidatus Peribacteria bacterium]|nr:MAG: hypothetical protein H6767_00555 [Candidatus Peribacteria bacterium]
MTVVIILSVLSSIAFLSLQGYVRDSRDSVRAMDVKTMATSLDLFDLQTGFFPTPTDAVPISFSGQTAWLQGTFGESVFRNVERLSFIPLDPLTEQPYAYSTTSNRFSYELG